MFVCAVKATWKRVAVILLVAVAVIGLLVVWLGGCQAPAEEDGEEEEADRKEDNGGSGIVLNL